MNQKVIKLGLIGAGRWGPNLIGSLRRIEGVQIEHIADKSQEAIQNIEKRFDNIIPHKDPQTIIKQNDLDAVLIATPVDTHLSLVEQVLQSGKNVFVEKPFGKSVEKCKSLCDLAKRNDLQIMVGHVFLFNASILALKNIIDSGELGKVMHLEAHRTNLGPVRKDVNAVWDLTSHDLSIFDFLLDDLPKSVSCIGSSKLDGKVEDTSYTTFKYSNNILAHAHASWLNPRKVRQITVIGDKKMAIWDDLNLEHPITIYDSSIGFEQSYYSDSFASHRLSYNRGSVVLPAISTNEPLLQEMNHFVEVINKNVKNRCSGKYATEVVKSLVHADQSLIADGKFVKIKR
ncbi:MAG: Gfo/Idh/MocA family oxidoreductase [Opitutae bacterium]